jgi:hypothetical protein
MEAWFDDGSSIQGKNMGRLIRRSGVDSEESYNKPIGRRRMNVGLQFLAFFDCRRQRDGRAFSWLKVYLDARRERDPHAGRKLMAVAFIGLLV